MLKSRVIILNKNGSSKLRKTSLLFITVHKYSDIQIKEYHKNLLNINNTSMKHFFEIYPPKRIWRKIWLGVANFPMLPQHRAKILKLAGVNIQGRALIYGNVLIDTVAPDKIYIGNNVAITAGTKILTHYLDPSTSGRQFRIGKVHIEDDVFIGVNTIICNSVVIGKGAIIGAGSVVTKSIPPYQVWAGNPAKFIKERKH